MLIIQLLIFLIILHSSEQQNSRQPYFFQTSSGNIFVEFSFQTRIIESDTFFINPKLLFKLSNGTILNKVVFDTHGGPSVANFMTAKVPEFSDSIILATAGCAGGSNSYFETTIVGIVNGQVKDLFRTHLITHNQGAICIEAATKSDPTKILLWNDIWEGIAHFDSHRYQAEIFQWDGSSFVITKTVETKKEYSDWMEASKQFRYHNNVDVVVRLLGDYGR
jgi:hypothetical protein